MLVVKFAYLPAHYYQFKGMVEFWHTLIAAAPDLATFTVFLIIIIVGFAQWVSPRPALRVL